MPELIAKPALGHAPLTRGGATLSEAPMARITAIAPYPGQAQAVGAALGAEFPAPNTFGPAGAGQLVWAGRALAYLIDAEPPEALPAAVTDQSDGWVTLRLSGPALVAVLARLVPLDLRAIRAGQCFRTGLNHLPLLLIVDEPQSVRLLTFRSMAQTAWHELETAMEQVQARAELTA